MSSSALEILRLEIPSDGFRAAIFDFDGTLSLLRRNWQDVMIPQMVEVLAETPNAESQEELRVCVEDFVMRLNGRQTIYQMIQLAEEVEKRGGHPLDPLDYKNRYHDRLWAEVEQRVNRVQLGSIAPEEMTVPESHRLLGRLQESGLTLYLASGTDLKYVRNEVELLGLGDFFADRVFGALDDYRRFSKAMVIRQIIEETGVRGDQLLGFGDGFVEIEEVRRCGGLAIGVASDENARTGVNAWKRQRLLEAGADIVIGDYRCQDELLATLRLPGCAPPDA